MTSFILAVYAYVQFEQAKAQGVGVGNRHVPSGQGQVEVAEAQGDE